MNSKKILISGSTGFVGKNFSKYQNIGKEWVLNNLSRKDLNSNNVLIGDNNIVLHFAGKAHDLKKISSEEDYFNINYGITKNVFDAFFNSNAEVFIFISSVKAVADSTNDILDESYIPNPQTAYGKSKLKAEQLILANLPNNKRVYILRPCMIHGPGNKGNLNLLYKIVSKGIPWPLGTFNNKRSFCSIENLCFVIKELIERNDIPSGVYNIADDIPLSTNELIQLIASTKNKKGRIFHIPKSFIRSIAKLGDFLKLPLNSERLQKLTESYIVSNAKLVNALGKPLPITSIDGLKRTFLSFSEV